MEASHPESSAQGEVRDHLKNYGSAEITTCKQHSKHPKTFNRGDAAEDDDEYPLLTAAGSNDVDESDVNCFKFLQQLNLHQLENESE